MIPISTVTRSRGQSEIVGAVLVVGIIIGAIAAAYTWGVPLLTKSSDVNRVDFVRSLMNKAAERVMMVVREGGQATLNVQVDQGDFVLEKDKTGEYVLRYELGTKIQFFPETESPLNDWVSPYAREEHWTNTTPESFTHGYCTPADARKGQVTLGGVEYDVHVCKIYDAQAYDVIYLESGSISNALQEGDYATGEFMVKSIDVAGTYVGFEGGWTTVEGVAGVSEPVVVMGQSEGTGGDFLTALILKPRDIVDPSRDEVLRIEFKPMEGVSTFAAGTFKLHFRYDSERVIEESGKTIRVATVEIGMR